jgi:hypothetical protein
MKKVLSIQEKLPKQVTMPDGIYLGNWSGHEISVSVGKRNFDLTTDEGVRGINVTVVVTIKDGEATFEEINN